MNPRTFIIDLDGTIVLHNGYKTTGDTLLPNVRSFWKSISPADVVIITTARSSTFRKDVVDFLAQNAIRFDYLIMDLPTGMRVLINDRKPDGSCTAKAVNLVRDVGFPISVIEARWLTGH